MHIVNWSFDHNIIMLSIFGREWSWCFINCSVSLQLECIPSAQKKTTKITNFFPFFFTHFTNRYMKYLYPYECDRNQLSTPNQLQVAIDGNRREGRRSGQFDPQFQMVSSLPLYRVFLLPPVNSSNLWIFDYKYFCFVFFQKQQAQQAANMQQMNPLGMMEYFKFLQENAARKLPPPRMYLHSFHSRRIHFNCCCFRFL